MTLTLAAGLAFTANVPAEVSAQAAGSFVLTLDSIGPGCCTLRIRQNGQVAQGRFQGRPDRESVLLSPCRGPLCGAVTDAARGLPLLRGAVVEMRSGTLAGKGLLIGALSGAGLVVGMVLIDGCDCEISAGDYALLGLVGAAGGGAIGTLVGALIPTWIPVRH